MPVSVPSQPPVSIQPSPASSQTSNSNSGNTPAWASQTSNLELENQGIGYQASNNFSSNVPEPPIGQNIDNADTQQQIALTNVGVNSLRPEIVATTEFVPLANDDNRSITTSNYTLNLGSLEIEVTGLTKLLEKQLIMNQTVAKNIEKFISVAAGFSLDEFLRIVKESVKGLDIPLGDIQGMKTAIVREIQNIGNLRTQSIQAVESAGRYNNLQNGPSGRSNTGGVLNSTRNLLDNRVLQQNLKKIETLFDSPYADLAFEYVARDIFIDKSIRFIDGLITLKEKLARSLDIGNCDVQNNLEIENELINFITNKAELSSSGQKPNVDFTAFNNYYLRFVALRNNENADVESIILNQSGTKKLLTILKALSADILFEKQVGSSSGGPSLEDLTNPNSIPSFASDRGEFENLKRLDAVNLYYLKERVDSDYGDDASYEPDFDMKIGKPYKDEKIIRQFVYCLSDLVYANNFNGKDSFETTATVGGFDNPAYDDDSIDLPLFIQKLIGFNTPTTSTENVTPYVFNNQNPNNDSIARQIVGKRDYSQQSTVVAPLENNYEDLNTNEPFEKGQNFFVDGSLLAGDLNFSDLRLYTSLYETRVKRLTNDYLRLHGQKSSASSLENVDFDFVFNRFKRKVANYIKKNFIDSYPSRETAYAFLILMTAAKNTRLANLIFRNSLFFELYDSVGITKTKKEGVRVVKYAGTGDVLQDTIYRIQNADQLEAQIFNIVGKKLLGIKPKDMEGNNFQDKHVPEKTGENANLGTFPDNENDYSSDYAVSRQVLITSTVAHGPGTGSGGEKANFQNAFNEIRKIINLFFNFDNNLVQNLLNTNENLNFLADLFSDADLPRATNLFQNVMGDNAKVSGEGGNYINLRRTARAGSKDADSSQNYLETNFGSLFKTLDTSYLGRAYSYYMMFLRMIYSCLSCKGVIRKTGSNNGSPREFNFIYSKTQFMGFVDALSGNNNGYTIIDSSTGNPISPAEASALNQELSQFGVNVRSFSLKESNFYEKGTSSTNSLSTLVNDRRNTYFMGGINHLLIMATHVNALRKNLEALKNYLNPNSQEDSDQKQIVNYFVNNQNGASLAAILSDGQIRAIRASQLKLFKPTNENYTLPSNNQFSHPQVKNMIKYLTQPDFGYLNSEKLGRKTMIHVGIPLGLIERLRKLSTRSTLDAAYENSNIIAIYIHRQNLLNPKEKVYPKTFLFDISRFVLENPDTSRIDNTHITDFVDNQIVESLIEKHVIYKVGERGDSNTSPGEGNSIEKRTGTAYKNSNGDSRYSRELKEAIFKNHLTDHYLKLYNRVITGIDLQEHTFQLFDDYNLQGLTSDPDKQSLFNGDLKDKTLVLFPGAANDLSIAREYFRLHRGAGNSFLFKSKGYMDAVLQGKIFDRIFSMMINERDFIIHPDTFTSVNSGPLGIGGQVQIGQQLTQIETIDQIYDRIPKFTLDGKLQLGNTTVKTQVAMQYPVLRSYSNSLNPDSTQIYNYTIEVSLLPAMIEEND